MAFFCKDVAVTTLKCGIYVHMLLKGFSFRDSNLLHVEENLPLSLWFLSPEREIFSSKYFIIICLLLNAEISATSIFFFNS